MRNITAKCVQALAISALCSAMAQADGPSGVVKWVDQNGVTHFSDAQFGARGAQPVAIAPANGMDKPNSAGLKRATGPSFIKINKAKKRNKDGWRGHNKNNGIRRTR